MAADTAGRMNVAKYAHVSELCDTLTNVARSLQFNIAAPSTKDIKLIKPLSDAILLAFNPDSDAQALSNQISGAVSGFQKRQDEKRLKLEKANATTTSS